MLVHILPIYVLGACYSITKDKFFVHKMYFLMYCKYVKSLKKNCSMDEKLQGIEWRFTIKCINLRFISLLFKDFHLTLAFTPYVLKKGPWKW